MGPHLESGEGWRFSGSRPPPSPVPHLGQLLPLSGQPSPACLSCSFSRASACPNRKPGHRPRLLSAPATPSPSEGSDLLLPSLFPQLPGQPLPLHLPTGPRPLPACLVASPSCLPGARRGALLPVPPAKPFSCLQRRSGKQGLEPKHREEGSIPSTPDGLPNSTRSHSQVQRWE